MTPMLEITAADDDDDNVNDGRRDVNRESIYLGEARHSDPACDSLERRHLEAGRGSLETIIAARVFRSLLFGPPIGN